MRLNGSLSEAAREAKADTYPIGRPEKTPRRTSWRGVFPASEGELQVEGLFARCATPGLEGRCSIHTAEPVRPRSINQPKV
jgi:hypothetical protein